jgi:uncharacterized membrane protein YkvA (DUF1232 family)
MADTTGFTIDTAEPTPQRTIWEIGGEALMALPNLTKLLYRLLRDPRVSRRRKLMVGIAGLYVVSPVDLVPEMLLPVIGRLDDILLAVFSIHYLLRGTDEDTLAEYWDGSRDALDLVAALIEWGAEFLPQPIRRALEP